MTLLIVWFLVIPVAAVMTGLIATRVRSYARSRPGQRLALVRRERRLAQ